MQKMAHNPYAYQAPKVTNSQATLKFGIRKAEAQEREKKKVLSERVQPLNFGPNPTKDKLRQLAQELVEKLTTAYGKFFDLEYQTERSKYTIHELKTRIKAMNKYSYERQAKVSAGGLSNIVKQLEQAQDGLPKSRLEREKQAGSILSSGGVKARLAMFGGGSNQSKNNEEETRKQLIDLTK
ncbi:uncharacterized protein LOC117102873 [Anneissia japonica]|uniref:uncharacterized protein LOC117102873 n=1 Tax=Anneissia japonica TaxID=1529436 RepID=UPI001425560D|nr:uncharacterized protein LOC117102873 [Anneissia japonica]